MLANTNYRETHKSKYEVPTISYISTVSASSSWASVKTDRQPAETNPSAQNYLTVQLSYYHTQHCDNIRCKYGVWAAFNGVTFVPSFIKIDQTFTSYSTVIALT